MDSPLPEPALRPRLQEQETVEQAEKAENPERDTGNSFSGQMDGLEAGVLKLPKNQAPALPEWLVDLVLLW